MLKVASVIWVILSVAFAGSLVIIVLAVPSPAQTDMRAIPIAAVVGALLAIPASWYVAKKIIALTTKPQS